MRENEDKTRCFAYFIVFALCRGKSKKVYTKIFEILRNSFFRNNEDNLIPKVVHSDCETSFINAAKKFFPNIDLQLCEVTHVFIVESRCATRVGHDPAQPGCANSLQIPLA